MRKINAIRRIPFNVFSMILFSIMMTSCSYSQNKILIDEVVSPTGDYKAFIWRDENEKRNFISLKTVKNNEEISQKDPIYYEGAFDTLFETKYPNRLWIRKNSLWMGVKSLLDNSNHIIEIDNLSDKVIKKLTIKTEDLYFIYDIHPNDKITIPVVWTNNKRPNVIVFAEVILPNDVSQVSEQKFPFPERDGSKISIEITNLGLILGMK